MTEAKRSPMVGRLYTWRGQTWRVLERWGRPGVGSPVTFVCPVCGACGQSAEGVLVGRLIYRCAWCHEHGREVFMRRAGGPPRNVLLERVVLVGAVAGAPGSGLWVSPGSVLAPGVPAERVVRPFRGLRRWRG